LERSALFYTFCIGKHLLFNKKQHTDQSPDNIYQTHMNAEIQEYNNKQTSVNKVICDLLPVGNGIQELKIDYAKGYRVYFKESDGKIIILLIGGDKSTQQKDIEKAKEILKRIKK
jgi:putative addiction module killer protein